MYILNSLVMFIKYKLIQLKPYHDSILYNPTWHIPPMKADFLVRGSTCCAVAMVTCAAMLLKFFEFLIVFRPVIDRIPIRKFKDRIPIRSVLSDRFLLRTFTRILSGNWSEIDQCLIGNRYAQKLLSDFRSKTERVPIKNWSERVQSKFLLRGLKSQFRPILAPVRTDFLSENLKP